MGLLSWIIVGGLAGALAKAFTGGAGWGCFTTIIIGIIGAFIGGWVMSLMGFGGVNGLNIWSILVATVGAVILLLIARLVRRG